MPTYLYECPNHGEFEEYHSISIVLDDCPKCKEEGIVPLKIKKLINCSSRGVVPLTGQDLSDKIKTDAAKLQRDAAKDERVYSNLMGESKYQQLQTQMDRRRR